ncbi:hypothetical protein GTP81_17460 [Rugamonas sp. FT107W]|uniref:DUF1640 domain-containing protein n=1 Tax=Duganella vulcania TaxID=2692166 RepID=A0A845HM62_9BURK|nr:hypothetical protein [Duganella vulcania]MYN18539.1 hypothetical protein [Duganella vulcania]
MPEIFDTVPFIDTLIEGGMPEKQAKALAWAMVQLIDNHLVTKQYLDMRLAQLKAELIQWITQWTFGAIVVQTGVIAVLFKLMH